jgi:hypothetical protein
MNDKTTKERLATIEESIKHIDSNIEKIANNNVNQWKQINKNAQCIAGIKGASGVIAGMVTLIMNFLMALCLKFIYGGR